MDMGTPEYRIAFARVRAALAEAGIATAELDARLLLQAVGGDAVRLEALLVRRVAREPMSQVLGSKGFWTLDLAVTRDVLTPRPDTETILDRLLVHRPDRAVAYRMLDLGTGSGCIVLAALSEYGQAQAHAVDVSAHALAVARANACAVGLDGRVAFFEGRWCAPLPDGARYDVVFSNPPYIPTADIAMLDDEVRVYEPHLALDGGEDGLDCYRVLAKQIHSRMVDGAIALLEVGAGQSDDVAEIMGRSGLAVLEIAKDLAGIARVVVLSR